MSCCAPTTTGGSTDGGDCACTYIKRRRRRRPLRTRHRRPCAVSSTQRHQRRHRLAWHRQPRLVGQMDKPSRVDLPRANDQNFDGLNVAGTLTTLWEHTYASDAAGANVAGRDGEDWWAVWSLKICGDPGQPLTDATARLESHKAGSWQLEDAIHGRPVTGLTPSWPMTRPFLLTNTRLVEQRRPTPADHGSHQSLRCHQPLRTPQRAHLPRESSPRRAPRTSNAPRVPLDPSHRGQGRPKPVLTSPRPFPVASITPTS